LTTETSLTSPYSYLASDTFTAIFNHRRVERWRQIRASSIQRGSLFQLGLSNKLEH